jgi:hypothetical protein
VRHCRATSGTRRRRRRYSMLNACRCSKRYAVNSIATIINCERSSAHPANFLTHVPAHEVEPRLVELVAHLVETGSPDHHGRNVQPEPRSPALRELPAPAWRTSTAFAHTLARQVGSYAEQGQPA